MTTVRVMVRLKEGVLDPQGATVARSLKSLSFEEVRDVRVGKLVEIELEGGLSGTALNERIREMCRKLLVNPVIEDYEILEA